MSDLIAAVDALTRPVPTKIVRDDGSTTRIVHDPLLTQLAEAVRSTITGKAGGGGGQSTGNVLNSAALFQASVISSQITEWCRDARAKVVRGDMVGNLTRWQVAFAGTADAAAFYEGALRGWAGTIRGMLNPRGRFQVTDPCVVCKATTYTEVLGEEEIVRPFPVIVEYDFADPVHSAVAQCLACEASWAGKESLEELGEELSTVLDE